MCNLSQGYYENGLKDGLKKGKQEGKQEGRREERRNMIADMLRNGNTPEDIAKFARIPIDEVNEVENQLLATESK